MARVEIDGIILGEYVIFPLECIVIKRGPKEDRSLVFVSPKSSIDKELGIDSSVPLQGDILVNIFPEDIPVVNGKVFSYRVPGTKPKWWVKPLGDHFNEIEEAYGAVAGDLPEDFSDLKVTTDASRDPGKKPKWWE